MVEVTKKGGAGGKALGCIGLVVLGFVGLGALGSALEDEIAATDASESAGLAEEATASTGEESAPSTAERTNWSYSEKTDELRGSTDYFARIVSENEVEFDFPYSGGSRLVMTVRQSKAYGSDVIFHITDGQFICGIYDCAGMISFDGSPEKLSLSNSADHDSQTLFATYDAAILRKLKAADRVVVELPFYQEGNRQFTFETAGLDWEH